MGLTLRLRSVSSKYVLLWMEVGPRGRDGQFVARVVDGVNNAEQGLAQIQLPHMEDGSVPVKDSRIINAC